MFHIIDVLFSQQIICNANVVRKEMKNPLLWHNMSHKGQIEKSRVLLLAVYISLFSEQIFKIWNHQSVENDFFHFNLVQGESKVRNS